MGCVPQLKFDCGNKTSKIRHKLAEEWRDLTHGTHGFTRYRGGRCCARWTHRAVSLSPLMATCTTRTCSPLTSPPGLGVACLATEAPAEYQRPSCRIPGSFAPHGTTLDKTAVKVLGMWPRVLLTWEMLDMPTWKIMGGGGGCDVFAFEAGGCYPRLDEADG